MGIGRHWWAFWIAIAVLLVALFNVWPSLAENEWFFAGSVACIILAALVVVWLMRRKA